MVIVNSAPQPDQFLSPVSRRWLSDGRVVEYRLANSHDATIDTYVEMMLDALLNRDLTQPFLVIHDISNPDVTLTPHYRQRMQAVEQFLQQHPQVSGRVAMILPNTVMYGVFTNYAQKFIRRCSSALEQRYFANYERGYAWIAEYLTR